MAYFSLDNFKATVLNTGAAKQNRFEMLINPPAALASRSGTSQLVSLYCEITNFPPLNALVRPFNLYGPNYQRPVSIDFGGDGLAATFLVDRDMRVKTFFDEWMLTMVDQYTYNVTYQNQYATNIEINQLNEQDEETYSIYLEDAFPRSLNVIDLNMNSQNQVHRLTVVFAYRRWQFSDAPNYPNMDTVNELKTNRLPNSTGSTSRSSVGTVSKTTGNDVPSASGTVKR